MPEAYEVDLIRKVDHLARSRFGGDYRKMFDHYALKRPRTAHLDSDEFMEMLKDADVGNLTNRSAWAKGVVEKLDTNHDRFISFFEFQKMQQF